ncbi:MAG TPA: hypothetical protein VIH93_05460 [Thermoanaerobaculia bacterium]
MGEGPSEREPRPAGAGSSEASERSLTLGRRKLATRAGVEEVVLDRLDSLEALGVVEQVPLNAGDLRGRRLIQQVAPQQGVVGSCGDLVGHGALFNQSDD